MSSTHNNRPRFYSSSSSTSFSLSSTCDLLILLVISIILLYPKTVISTETFRRFCSAVINSFVVPLYTCCVGTYYMTCIWPHSGNYYSCKYKNDYSMIQKEYKYAAADAMEQQPSTVQQNTRTIPIHHLNTTPTTNHRTTRENKKYGVSNISDENSSPVLEKVIRTTTISHQRANIINLTGTYKLCKNEGFEAFLAANGVPFLLRKAANSVQPIHKITHNDDTHTIRVQISGIITGDITYSVNGPSVESTIQDRRFMDSVTYLEEGDGIRIYKKAVGCSDRNWAKEIIVTRRVIDNGAKLLLTSKAYFENGTAPIEYQQWFERQV